MITRLDVGDTLSDGLDDTCALVPQNNGESSLGVLSGECVGICKAQLATVLDIFPPMSFLAREISLEGAVDRPHPP